jgi:uncharacterized membrane protein
LNGLQFEPPVSLATLALLVAGLLAVAALLRFAGGQAARPARGRWGLAVLRGVALALLALILLGPVWVDETPGRIDRPDLFYLLDASQSMDIGQSQTRFGQAVSTISAAEPLIPDDARGSVKLFEFGHRLQALGGDDGQSADLSQLRPDETDTRLAEALRQLSGRFGSRPPAGVVLFSDGRVRDIEGVRQLAEHFAERGVPIHVHPPLATAEGGDVSIVSVVVPQRVRKYSDVDVQVFLRSSGYVGQRLEVQLVAPATPGRPEELLASMPVTLKGGAQSAPLTYRSDMRGRKFEVRAVPFKDEISFRNNVVEAEVQIDRPKIRVLYLEGSAEPSRVLAQIFGQQVQAAGATGPQLALQQALAEDEDIECVALVREAGGNRLVRPSTGSGQPAATYGFPRTQAELSAFDCVILSDVSRQLLTDQQIDWLADWVENRGGGLLMTGGEESFAAGGWADTKLAELLPVSFPESRWNRVSGDGVVLEPDPSAARHPIWQIVIEPEINRRILSQLPPLAAVTANLRPKPVADVLAVGHEGESSALPALVAGRYGRGRTMACSIAVSSPEVDPLMERWGAGGSRYGAKLWRNIVYWLTESSSIGRRRLVAAIDKRFYRPADTIRLAASAYDETAHRTTDYSVWGMIEPKSFDLDAEDVSAPVHWPNGVARESGEDGPRIIWGEEFELPRDSETGEYLLPLEISERLRGGRSDEGFRIELTAYERSGSATAYSHGTQVDSTSIDVQILDDPFEQQNTFANHDLLKSVASLSGGKVIETPEQLAALVSALPVEVGPSTVSRTPAWSLWWVLAVVLGLWTAEWTIRRATGLA